MLYSQHHVNTGSQAVPALKVAHAASPQYYSIEKKRGKEGCRSINSHKPHRDLAHYLEKAGQSSGPC